MWPFKKRPQPTVAEPPQCLHRNASGQRCLRDKAHTKFLNKPHYYAAPTPVHTHHEPHTVVDEPSSSGLLTGLIIGSMLGDSGSAATLPTVADDTDVTPAFGGFGGGESGGAGAGGSWDAPSDPTPSSDSSVDTSSSSDSSSSDSGSSDSSSGTDY